MANPGVGDYFITDVDDDTVRDDERMPLVVPVVDVEASRQAASQAPPAAGARAAVGSDATVPEIMPPSSNSQRPQEARSEPVRTPAQPLAETPERAAGRAATEPETQSAPAPGPSAAAQAVRVGPAEPSREDLLLSALDELLDEDRDIQAAALVSLDGFTMASALPADMQSDRVGAMSAAILALGERASAELGRGRLSQVFIEGEDGYVFLIAAGTWAVLTAIADPSAKLGLVIYDMKKAAERIGQILG